MKNPLNQIQEDILHFSIFEKPKHHYRTQLTSVVSSSIAENHFCFMNSTTFNLRARPNKLSHLRTILPFHSDIFFNKKSLEKVMHKAPVSQPQFKWKTVFCYQCSVTRSFHVYRRYYRTILL